jgi:putative ABC transport system permease protein
VGSTAIFGLKSLLEWHMSLSPLAIGVSLTVSGVIGVAFGFIPARRAASLDPIEALRHE